MRDNVFSHYALLPRSIYNTIIECNFVLVIALRVSELIINFSSVVITFLIDQRKVILQK